jgi:hypothetical protein
MARDDGWEALYLSVPTPLKKRMQAAADADGRKLSKWVERLIADHFAEEDLKCETSSSATDLVYAACVSSLSRRSSKSVPNTTNTTDTTMD